MKKFASVLLLLMLLITLCACGEKEEKKEEAAPVDLPAILTSFSLNEDMMTLAEGDMLDLYGIEAADMKQFAAAVNSTGVKCDEFILVEAVDADAAARVKEALDNRYESKLNELDGYLPDEYAVAQKCAVEAKGNFVSLIVSENAADLTKIYHESVK